MNGGKIKMKNMMKICIWMLFVMSLYAQAPVEHGRVSVGLSYQRWAFEYDDNPIQQYVAPIQVFLMPTERLYLNISNSPTSTRYSSVEFSGISDTWIRATYVMPNNRLMFNLGIGAPTGVTKLSDTESFLTQLLSEQAFQFRSPSYGQGLNVRAGFALALPYQENFIFGLGANYIYKASYYPMATDSLGEYLPGDEISLFAGVDALLSETSKLKLDLVYSIYGTDEYDTEKIYSSGNRILAILSYQGLISEKPVRLSLRFRQKGRNEFWAPQGNSPDSYLKNGNQIEFNGVGEIYQQDKITLSGLLDARIYSKNENELRDASIFGIGIGGGYQYSSNTVFQLNLKYLTGSYQGQGVSGFDIYGSISYQF